MTSDGKPFPDGKVLLRATHAESAGAGLRVAGLSVCERSWRQLRSVKLEVVLASDGSCPLPKTLPSGIDVRAVASADDMDKLRSELAGVQEVGADEVRPVARDFASAIRVTDARSNWRMTSLFHTYATSEPRYVGRSSGSAITCGERINTASLSSPSSCAAILASSLAI